MSTRTTIAVLADTHIRTEPHDPQAAYPSDALHNERARRAVRQLCRHNPASVVHLGDVTHTLPGLPTHEAAQQIAREILGGLGDSLRVAPGNHDVGDKPDSRATAPRVDPEGRRIFERYWGPCWQSWDVDGCHLVTLDTAVLNTGSRAEAEQRAWLEADLAGHGRSFLFTHYPPFILRPDEPAHYDNLAEPARSWLLRLLRSHRVEAVFSGHAHTFFYNRVGATHLYVLPSTAFVRPEYSELFAVGPAAEYGRDDADKLGATLVHVEPQGHRIELVRIAVGDPGPVSWSDVGVWLRGGWARVVDLPCGDLDEFRRKPVRNDYPVLALLDLGIRRVRIPLSDLEEPRVRDRVADLLALGLKVLVFSPGVPHQRHLDVVSASADLVEQWEVILPPGPPAGSMDALGEVPVPIALSRVAAGELGDGYFSHFPDVGLLPDDPDLDAFADLHEAVTHLAFRVPHDAEIGSCVAAAGQRAREVGLGAICHVELPRAGEARIHDDDRAVARRVLEARQASEVHRAVRIYLDTFEDKDRGYNPRHGLIDRRGNTRLAGRVLRSGEV